MNITIGNITILIEDLGIYDLIQNFCISCLPENTKAGLLVVVAVIILGATLFFGLNPDHSNNKSMKRALIVAAYPGDECLYFSPTILRLKASRELHLLVICEESRSYMGDGPKIELWNSCLKLGIPRENIMMMHITQGSYQPNRWHPLQTCNILLDHIVSMSFDEVYTMEIGISRQSRPYNNLFFGFAYMALNNLIPPRCQIFTMKSVNCIRKYSFFLDIFISCFSKYLFVIRLLDRHIVHDSIRMHTSRFGILPDHLIYLSRYVYINTYKLLKKKDVEFVLQVPEYKMFFIIKK